MISIWIIPSIRSLIVYSGTTLSWYYALYHVTKSTISKAIKMNGLPVGKKEDTKMFVSLVGKLIIVHMVE